MMCAIFQTNTNLLKIYEHINICTQKTLLHLEILPKYISSFFPKAIDALSLLEVFRSIHVLSYACYSHFQNILRLFDVLPNFPFTTTEMMPDYYL